VFLHSNDQAVGSFSVISLIGPLFLLQAES
jgi:hypothetical protein